MVGRERLGGKEAWWAGLPTWATHNKVQHIAEPGNPVIKNGRICQVTSWSSSGADSRDTENVNPRCQINLPKGHYARAQSTSIQLPMTFSGRAIGGSEVTRFGTSEGDPLLLSVSPAAHLAGYLPTLWDTWPTRNSQNFLDNSTTTNLSSLWSSVWTRSASRSGSDPRKLSTSSKCTGQLAVRFHCLHSISCVSGLLQCPPQTPKPSLSTPDGDPKGHRAAGGPFLSSHVRCLFQPCRLPRV